MQPVQWIFALLDIGRHRLTRRPVTVGGCQTIQDLHSFARSPS